MIAADSGLELAHVLGVPVDLAIGDFDSASDAALASAGRIERHPAEKDATDLELALAEALRLSPERILVVGGAGGRLDHLLGGLLLLAHDAYAGVEVDAVLGTAAVHVVRKDRTVPGAVGELVSLFAVHGVASRIVTDGLAYPLSGETLEPGSSRGLSNRFADTEARIRLDDGVLLAVRPTRNVPGGS